MQLRRLFSCLLCLTFARAADWPAFRGPNSSGIGRDSTLPVEMGLDKNLVWKTPLPPGHSSPVLVGDSIFVTAWQDDKLLVISLDRQSGRIRWRREIVRPRRQELHKSNSPASPSVASDGRNVYAFFTDFGLVAYGWDGQERWRLPLGPFNNPFGMGASPLLVGDRILQICDSETGSFLLAVQKDSGKTLWRVDRPDVSRGFSTPVLYEPPTGAKQALIAGSYQLTSYNVETGAVEWFYRGLTWQLKPTPVVDGGRLYVLGWAGGSDEGNQEDVPPYADALRRMDKDSDGKLSKAEIEAVDPKLVSDWEQMDLDRDNHVGERDWQMYQARRKSLNAITAIRLGGKGDVTETNFLWRYTEVAPQRPIAPRLRQRRLHDQGWRHLHVPRHGNRQSHQTRPHSRRARTLFRLPRSVRRQDFPVERGLQAHRGQGCWRLGNPARQRPSGHLSLDTGLSR